MKLSLCTAAALLLVSTSLHAQHSTPETLDDQCWQTTFVEPFDQLSLYNEQTQEGRWRTRYIWGRDTIINNELQYYADPQQHDTNPFSIHDGVLAITASKTPASQQRTTSQAYLSGVLTTEKDFNQKFGRFEVRAQVPDGKGLWSAFWLLPSFKQWPEGVAILPEIDVMEHLGDQQQTYHTTLHTNQTGKLTSHPYDHNNLGNLTADFHWYSVVWNAKEVSWYFDGKRMASHPTPADFTRPVHFLLNLAVGGNWPGAPDSSTEFPASYRIDEVRAWAPVERDGC